MRIALFTEVFLPKIDGVVTRILRSLDELERHGHEVLVFAPGHPPTSYARFRVVPVRAVSMRPWYPELKVGLPTPSIARELEQFAPHVIHAVNPVVLAAYGALSATRRDIPMLASFHTDTPKYADALGLSAVRHIGTDWLRTIHNLAEVNLCTSPQMVERAREIGIRHVGLWPKAVDTIGYAPERADPEMRMRLSGGHPDAKLLVYVGRMSKEKQLDELLPLIRRLAPSGVRLAMVGSGPHLEELRRQFAGTPTVFTGYLTGAPLAAAYASADVFVFPSRTETLGFVAMESQASGVPVVGANAGGIPSALVDGVTGILYPPGDEQSLFEAVTRLVDDDALRRRMGAAGRAEAERWSWRAATDGLVDAYGEAIDRHWRHRERRVAQGKPKYSLPMRLFGRPMPRPHDPPAVERGVDLP